MTPYEKRVLIELHIRQNKMQSRLFSIHPSKNIQNRNDSFIPEKVDDVVTPAIRQVLKAALFESEVTTHSSLSDFRSTDDI